MTKSNKSILISILLLISIIIFWASYKTLWLGDDFVYQYQFEQNHTPDLNASAKSIDNFSDVLVSQYYHYSVWNGRVTAHILVQAFCGILGHGYFALCNAIFYIFLICGTVYLTRGNLNSLNTWLSCVFLVLLTFVTKMTPSCQIGYIWMAALNVGFLCVFLKGGCYKWWQLICIACLSIIAGNGHEAYSIGFSLGIIVYWILNIKTFGTSRYVAAISYGIGTLILCLSPAAHNRAVSKEIDVFQSIFFFVFSLRAVYILLAIMIYQLITRKITIRSILQHYSFYCVALIGCLLFNLLIGVYCNRQLFGAELIAIILTLKILPRNSFSKFWMFVIGLITLACIALNIERVYLFQKQTENIYSKFLKSTDGRVYQDTWHPGLIESWAPYFWENEYHSHTFRKLLKREYPQKPEITVLPEYLEGKDTINLGNQVFHFKYKPGKLICIQSKARPAKFLVVRKFFGLVPYQTREMDFSKPWYETKYWKAIVYEELNPVVLNTDVRIVQDNESL